MSADDVVIDPRDKKYFVAKPDPSFSPQRNLAIIKEVHEDTKKFFASLTKKYQDGLDDRTDVLNSFALYKFNKGGDKTFNQYIGKDLRRRLVGERLLEKVRVLSTIDKLSGRTKIKL